MVVQIVCFTYLYLIIAKRLLDIFWSSKSHCLFTESAHWADSVLESQCPSVCVSVCAIVCSGFQGISLALRSNDQFPGHSLVHGRNASTIELKRCGRRASTIELKHRGCSTIEWQRVQLFSHMIIFFLMFYSNSITVNT